MADDRTTKDADLARPPTGSGILPIHIMPEDVLRDWAALPSGTAVSIPLTKQDLDNLFFSIANTQNALDLTNRAFVQWTNGQISEAQANLETSRQSLVSGMNSLRFFFEALVASVVKGTQSG